MLEVRARILKALKNEVSNQAFFEMIHKYPEIVDIGTLKSLVDIKKNNFLQQRIKIIFVNFI